MKPQASILQKTIPTGMVALLTTLSVATPARSQNFDHTQQLLSTRKCPRCELSNAGLVFANLSGADLSQANLAGANLSRANLQGADLRGANLTGASLYGANLVGAKLDGANLTVTDLRGAYMMGASLVETVMHGTLLQGAVGLSPETGSAEQFYQWALQDEHRKNYPGAIDNFTQALSRKPDFAQAYLGRGVVLLQSGEDEAGLADIRQAERLFTAQGNQEGSKLTQAMIKQLTTPPPQPKSGNGLGLALLGLIGTALQFLPLSIF
ncbi:pentapeptide repeat-containing protein [Leptothermofonsia sichuanensis]|uniref:pentapeptide repeat-containing protein n=1 Tax=Leptothermofonsia sichuanensis TaxID=2917832 RepID=UPI001CECE6A2|nr:pentapeptide repeat-containing protein [Leptothermofonsia sichuanensis]